jgi:predicted nucleic acid-binding protein
MRTTVEIRDEHRARLLDLAARRGEKGFSAILAEALDRYFATLAGEEGKRKTALGLRGCLSAEEAADLLAATRSLRAAQVRRTLEARGESIGMGDCLIAGIVLQHGAMLATRNRRHFERVPGLAIAGPRAS